MATNYKIKNIRKIYKKTSSKEGSKFDVKTFAYQMTDGIDLSEITEVNVNTTLTMMTETVSDLKSKFKSYNHFASRG